MRSNPSAWDLRDPSGSSAARHTKGLLGSARELIRGARDYIGLFKRTFATLPADVLAASIVINLLGLALPLAILQVYDRIIPRAATSTLYFLILGVCIALLLEAVLRVTRSQLIAWAAMREAWKTNIDAASRVALAPARLVDQEPAARWMQRFHAVGTVADFQLSPSRLIIVDLPFVFIFVAFLFAISGLLAAIPLVLFLLFAIGAIARGRAFKAATAARAMSEAKIRDFLHETLNGIVDVKAFAMEQQVQRRFERLEESASGCAYNVLRLSDNANSLGSLVSTLTQLTTVTVGAVLIINGEITIGALACCTMLSGRIMQPLIRLVSGWHDIHALMVAEETARPIFDLPRIGRSVPVSVAAIPARVTFDNVTFAYEGETEPVLCAANLCVEPGEIIALTGTNGCGRSSVARLALGRLLPQTGRVLIDDTPAVLAGTGLCGNLALVDHRAASIRGTIIDNLTMFGEGKDTAQSVARLIGLEDDICSLPRGYETRLGEAATESVPPGLLQRIVIARAIAGQPRLLVLDEANSSFDYRSDQLLGHGLLSLRGKVTIFLITNRPSFAAIADRVITIEGGKFVQLGKRGSIAQSVALPERVIA